MKINLDASMLHQQSGVNQLDQEARSHHPLPPHPDTSVAGRGPDIVEISDEARALLKAKMTEYGADTPQDLSAGQLDDLKRTMAEAEGVTDADRAALARQAAEADGEAAGPSAERTSEGDGTERKPPPPPRKQGGSNSDAIDDLKDEIASLEDEIEELRAKAATDEESKEELKSKQTELSLLESELSLLEQQAVAQSG